MFIQDESLVYKQYDCLYYALTKKNGKMILKNYYFKEAYPAIKSFFFITYEYDSFLLKQAENKNATSLIIQYMELEYIVSLDLIGESIFLFQYIFNYCIDYRMKIDEIWDQFSDFFKNNFSKKINSDVFIYNLLYQLGVVEIENDSLNDNNFNSNHYKKLILDALIKLNPNHYLYLNKIIAIKNSL